MIPEDPSQPVDTRFYPYLDKTLGEIIENEEEEENESDKKHERRRSPQDYFGDDLIAQIHDSRFQENQRHEARFVNKWQQAKHLLAKEKRAENWRLQTLIANETKKRQRVSTPPPPSSQSDSDDAAPPEPFARIQSTRAPVVDILQKAMSALHV